MDNNNQYKYGNGLPVTKSLPPMPIYAPSGNTHEERLKRRRNQVRDALQRTKDINIIEKIAAVLGV